MPDIHSSPIRRFISALDMWGSPIDSPARKLDSAAKIISVGDGLSVLAKRWGPVLKKGSQIDYLIPKLKCNAQSEFQLTFYQSLNPLSLMEFMFRCGPYLELSDEEFTEWAIDFASLTLMVGAFFEGIPVVERGLHGGAEVYSCLAHDIFFRPHGNWPNVESVKWKLQEFSKLDDSAIDYFSQRLMRACDVLNNELFAIGSDISIVKILSFKIKDRNKMVREYF